MCLSTENGRKHSVYIIEQLYITVQCQVVYAFFLLTYNKIKKNDV